MKAMLERLLTKEQQDSIVAIIKMQFERFALFEAQSLELFYQPYTKMRKKHNLTSAVISGFAPDRLNLEGITVSDLNYGLYGKMSQPELSCENGVFHIYSSGSDLKGAKIYERCGQYNLNLEEIPLFFIIVFHTSEIGNLTRVEMHLPDSNACIQETLLLYSDQND